MPAQPRWTTRWVGPGAVAGGGGRFFLLSSPAWDTSAQRLPASWRSPRFMGCSDGGPKGLPSSCPSQGGLGGQPRPSLPHYALLMGQASSGPICLQDGGQDEGGKDTGPAEAIKSKRPHKSSGMESVSGAAAALIKHSSDHMFPSTTTSPHPTL